MKTNFLTFFFCFTDFTEYLNALTCVRSKCLATGTPDFQKLCKYSSLANMMSHMGTFNIRHLRCNQTCYFHYCESCCAHKQLVTRTKNSKYTFVTLLKHCLPQNWINDIFASSYCVSRQTSVLLQQIYHF